MERDGLPPSMPPRKGAAPRPSLPLAGAAALLGAFLAWPAGCGAPPPGPGPLVPSAALDRYQRRLLPRGDGSYVTCYASPAPGKGPAPLVFFCQGGGYASMFVRDAAGDLHDRLGWVWTDSAFSGRIRLAFVEKRGVRLGDDGEGEPRRAALEHDTLEERVEDVLRALEVLLADPGTDRSRVALLGHGEGALVAAEAAARSKGVTHLGYFANGGLSHLLELAWTRRAELAAAGKEGAALEGGMDAFFETAARALRTPPEGEALPFGRTPSHVRSFWDRRPLDLLLRLEIPLFAAVPGRDPHVPAFSTDALRLAFLSAGKGNLTFRVYPGLDHGFTLPPSTEAAGGGGDPFRFPRVFDEFCAWFVGSP